MKYSNQGFILIATLCFLSVFILLIITGLHQILMYLQISNQQEKVHQQLYSMDFLAKQLVQNALTLRYSDCINTSKYREQDLVHALRESICALLIDGTKYKLFIEDLGEFSCLVIQKESVNYKSHHYALTITPEVGGDSHALILQIRYFVVSGLSECKQKVIRVSEGISTWRYFSN